VYTSVLKNEDKDSNQLCTVSIAMQFQVVCNAFKKHITGKSFEWTSYSNSSQLVV